MKKNLLILTFIVLCTTAFAQTTETSEIPITTGKRVSIGISIGPSMDWFAPRTDGYEKDGTMLGFRYGIPLDINLTKSTNFYFSTGIKFAHTGGMLRFNDVFIIDENNIFEAIRHRKYNAMYVALPTGVKLKTPTFNNFVIGGHLGLEHGISLSSKKLDELDVTILDTKLTAKDEKKSKYTDGYMFRESLYAGLGLEYIIKDSFRVNFYVNYNYTLNNFFKKGSVNEVSRYQEKANLHGVEFLLGFSF
jgi:hypothetical protein